MRNARKGTTGSRAWHDGAKAMEGVKRLEMQPRRTRRRKGRGMVGEPSWEQERPVSAPAVRPRGADRSGGLGASNPISGLPDEVGESGAGVGGGHSSDEGVDNRTRRSEGPLAECAAQRRGSGIAARLFTRGTTSRRDGCWDAGPTPVAGRNVARRLLGGEPCAGEPHARFREGRLETEPPRPPRQSPTLQGARNRTPARLAPISYGDGQPLAACNTDRRNGGGVRSSHLSVCGQPLLAAGVDLPRPNVWLRHRDQHLAFAAQPFAASGADDGR